MWCSPQPEPRHPKHSLTAQVPPRVRTPQRHPRHMLPAGDLYSIRDGAQNLTNQHSRPHFRSSPPVPPHFQAAARYPASMASSTVVVLLLAALLLTAGGADAHGEHFLQQFTLLLCTGFAPGAAVHPLAAKQMGPGITLQAGFSVPDRTRTFRRAGIVQTSLNTHLQHAQASLSPDLSNGRAWQPAINLAISDVMHRISSIPDTCSRWF